MVSIHTGTREGDAAGSGIVLSEDGLVLTNAHVVDGAQHHRGGLRGRSDRRGPTDRVGPRERRGAVKAEDLRSGRPGRARELRGLQVGDDVVAIGNALNLGDAPSVTTGIVSALSRSIQSPAGDSR